MTCNAGCLACGSAESLHINKDNNHNDDHDNKDSNYYCHFTAGVPANAWYLLGMS